MQTSPLVRNLRFAGLVIGFAVFAFTTIHWIQYSTNVQVVQHSPLIVRSR
ncbi:MAG: hypothetical protein ABIR37_04585 [Candidatus Saccharimonadales bacterium]